jgi:hypothetical protein
VLQESRGRITKTRLMRMLSRVWRDRVQNRTADERVREVRVASLTLSPQKN